MDGTYLEFCFGRVLTNDEYDKIINFLDENITDDWVGFKGIEHYEEKNND